MWLVAAEVDSVEEKVPIILEISLGQHWSEKILALRRWLRQTLRGALWSPEWLASKPLCEYVSSEWWG